MRFLMWKSWSRNKGLWLIRETDLRKSSSPRMLLRLSTMTKVCWWWMYMISCLIRIAWIFNLLWILCAKTNRNFIDHNKSKLPWWCSVVFPKRFIEIAVIAVTQQGSNFFYGKICVFQKKLFQHIHVPLVQKVSIWAMFQGCTDEQIHRNSGFSAAPERNAAYLYRWE